MSFAAEMKDFMSAAQAGQKMAGAVDDRAYKQALAKQSAATTEALNQKNNDTEGQALDQKIKEATLRNKQNLTAQGEEWIAGERAKRAAAAVPAPSLVAGMGAPPQSPLPQAQPGQAVPTGASVPAQGFSAGGSVQKFAGGGAVATAEPAEEPTEDLPTPPPPPPEAVPASDSPEDPTSGATDFSSRARGFSGQAGLDGVKAGLDWGSKFTGLHQAGAVASPGRDKAAKAWATGAHAAPNAEMDQIRAWVDPEKKMSESERNIAGVGAVYQFYANKGDSQTGAKLAFQMLQSLRQASTQYAVIAAHAAQKGDLDVATHAAMKAYANCPDDKEVQLQKTDDGQIACTYKDAATGKVMSKSIISPEKLGSLAMGFAEKGFDENLMAAIQQRPAAKPQPAVDPNTLPMKNADKDAALTGVDAAFKEQNPEPKDDKTPPKYAPDAVRDIKSAAFRISSHTSNPRITHDEAVSVASKIADPSIADKGGFKPKKVDGGYQVTFGTRAPTFVPEADFDTLMARRSAALDAKKAAPTEGSGMSVKGVIDGVKSAAGAAIDWASADIAKWTKANPEAAARIKSAINKGGEAASDAKAYLEKEMARPNIWKSMANGPGKGAI